MRQRLFLVVIGAIAIATGGCASEDTSTAPSPSPSAVASAPEASPSPGATAGQPGGKTQPFTQPLVAQKPTTQAIPGLIQPTNADERARQVQASINAQRGNKDPFSSLPPVLQRPTITQPTTTQPSTSSRSTPALPNTARPGRTASTPPNPSSPFPPNKNRTAKPLPPPPSTNLATAVEVTGVVYVNGRAQAIVKAPNEGTSRYVRVGQRLSDGQVLVKRIEINSGSDPVVVLEENGVEVPKVVGENAAQSQPGGRA